MRKFINIYVPVGSINVPPAKAKQINPPWLRNRNTAALQFRNVRSALSFLRQYRSNLEVNNVPRGPNYADSVEFADLGNHALKLTEIEQLRSECFYWSV